MVPPSITPVVCGLKPSARQIGGYARMARVASALIATTTKTTSADLPGYSGTTVEQASVAEAPQTAVPTPTNAPKPAERPPHDANTKPETIVAAIASTTSTAVADPSAAMSARPTRSPSSATAQRKMVRTQKAIPG